jgi:Putative prokaryotic signal transducing protein
LTKDTEQKKAASSGGEPVVVYQTSGQLNGHIVKSKLEAAGIPAMLQYESAGLLYGLTVDGMGLVRVLVPPQCAEEARKVLEGLDI